MGATLAAGLVVALVVGVASHVSLGGRTMAVLTGSLGSSAVLVCCQPRGAFARLRSVVGGHTIAAVAGVSVVSVVGGHLSLAAGLASSATFVLMRVTDTVHPPGGGTALIPVVGGHAVRQLGYGLVLPVLAGACVLALLAVCMRRFDERVGEERLRPRCRPSRPGRSRRSP